MATKTQQPPELQLAELTAAQFIDIWKHYDADGQCDHNNNCNIMHILSYCRLAQLYVLGW